MAVSYVEFQFEMLAVLCVELQAELLVFLLLTALFHGLQQCLLIFRSLVEMLHGLTKIYVYHIYQHSGILRENSIARVRNNHLYHILDHDNLEEVLY